ncbi:MAG: YhcH/YjgK/YiaL family protein, partial [Saprospiraceae bacterium]
IQSADLAKLEDGKSDIADGLKVIISNAPGKAKETSLTKFECHDRHIDIQLTVYGHECIAWKPRQDCKVPNGEYNSEKDVRFFGDAPDMFFHLTDGQFVIFFPDDVHAPMIGVEGHEGEPIKKMVIKVKI